MADEPIEETGAEDFADVSMEEDDPVPAPGNIAGASMLPPAPVEALEAIAAAVGRLRDEVAATDDKSRKARLLHEAGEIQERGGDEPGAARDYLAAYNADTSFREPLEGLVRVLERRRSLSNLGKLIEALVQAAVTPEERSRALIQRAIFIEDVQNDLEGARGAAREATETGALPADLGPAWLMLEMVAAKLRDAALREEALAGRAELTADPTWKGLLLVDAALLAAETGEVERALETLTKARAAGGGSSWASAIAVERIVRSDPGLSGSDDARARYRAAAEALESRAQMLKDAMGDPAQGDAKGVPRWCRSIEHVSELYLRAADARRNGNEIGLAAKDLDTALEFLAEERPRREDEPTAAGINRESAAAIERLVLTARLRLAEQIGNTALAAELAQRRMVGETDGGVVAALAMRVAEHAAAEGDVPRALETLTNATQRDPTSAPTRALQIDILEAGPDAARFANELEDLARQSATSGAKGRALLLAAHVWATRAKDASRARAALAQAAEHGISKDVAARLGRSLASVLEDDAWYEQATTELIEARKGGGKSEAAEIPLLWIELARLRLTHGDESGAAKATSQLRELAEGAWIGRILDGLASADASPERARSAVEELAKDVEDETLARSLAVVCAMRAHAAGDQAAAIAHLTKLADDDAKDPLVAAYLGDLFRLAGDRVAAALLARTVAEAVATDDPEQTAARLLEHGLETWRGGDRKNALSSFTLAAEAAPDAARPLMAWAARGVDVDAVEGRKRALEVAGSDPAVVLERFALEAASGDADEAANALAALEITSHPHLRLAGSLARLVWTKGLIEPEAVFAALDGVGATSARGKTAAAAERLRFVRETGGPGAEVVGAAKAWLDAGGGAAAAVEWIAAAMSAGDFDGEVEARRELAEILNDEARESMHASATLLSLVVRPDGKHPLVQGSSHAARLANLELAPPGCDPRRRASALSELDGALGEDAEVDAMALAAWSALAAGDAEAALDVFRSITAQRADDLHAWEGIRAAAEALKDHETYGVACEQLGLRCKSDPRGAAFWEQAALAWFKIGADERGEKALDASFARDARRAVAFDKLFRRVRERKDHDKLLDIIDRRLDHTDDAAEIAKLYWEQARVLREKGDPEGSMQALQHVFDFDDNHVGALALTGEIYIRKGMFAEAAEKLARLARVEEAPPKNRVTAGVAAVDLYENKLGRHDAALQVLLGLHAARLTTLPVRERLARAAARTGSWSEATRILEELMEERPEREGRIEAARLAMAIHRDRLLFPSGALAAATKLLSESPTDGEGLDLVVALDPAHPDRRSLLERGRDAILMALHELPNDLDMFRRLARISHALGDGTLEQAALSCGVALGGPDGSSEQMVALLASRKPRAPQIALTEPMLRTALAPGDDGPIADLFALLGPTLAEALGPTKEQVGVTKKDRVDAKSGLGLRQEIAQWASAFGIKEFDLYVGGKDPGGVQGIPGKVPAIVVGAQVNGPLSPSTRGRVARELLSIVRGTTVARWRDDATIAAIVTAACNIVKVRIDTPPVAVLAEVERMIGKAIPGKVKKEIEPICRMFVSAPVDPRQWAARTRASQGRIAVIAAGDVSVVLADVFGEPVERLGMVARDDLRAHDLLRFVLSRPYFDLRRTLGLEGAG